MQSGGFSPSSKVSKINSPALVLWGRQDGILDGTEFANKVRLRDRSVSMVFSFVARMVLVITFSRPNFFFICFN